jgi:uncharacterized protein YegP (UPF0339 family)
MSEDIELAGKFEVHINKAGKHRFHVKWSNGQIVLEIAS